MIQIWITLAFFRSLQECRLFLQESILLGPAGKHDMVDCSCNSINTVTGKRLLSLRQVVRPRPGNTLQPEQERRRHNRQHSDTPATPRSRAEADHVVFGDTARIRDHQHPLDDQAGQL